MATIYCASMFVVSLRFCVLFPSTLQPKAPQFALQCTLHFSSIATKFILAGQH